VEEPPNKRMELTSGEGSSHRGALRAPLRARVVVESPLAAHPRCWANNTATFLGVTGTLQAQQGAVYLVGEHLWTL